jgi:hypothetical protein
VTVGCFLTCRKVDGAAGLPDRGAEGSLDSGAAGLALARWGTAGGTGGLGRDRFRLLDRHDSFHQHAYSWAVPEHLNYNKD